MDEFGTYIPHNFPDDQRKFMCDLDTNLIFDINICHFSVKPVRYG